MSEGNGYATREALFGKTPERRFVDVEVEGLKFRLRSLMASEANQWAVKSQTDKGMVTAGPRLIVLCAVDKNGQPVFNGTDVSKLLDMDARFVQQLSKLCQDHSGIVDTAALEDVEKN